MASYLIIKNSKATCHYSCKSTHTGDPYLRIDSTGYLDLTTQNDVGMFIKLKMESSGNYITTLTSSVGHTDTTGYSGVSSSESTSGYSGVSSRESTSGYTGYLINSSTTWAGKGSTTIMSYSGEENYTSYSTGGVDDYDTAFERSERWDKTASSRNTSSSKLTTGSSSRYWDYPAGGGLQNLTILKESFTISTTYPVNSTTVTTYYNTYPSDFTSTNSNSQTYESLTSSADIGQLVSTTALTRSSDYNISSSTTNAGLSSTTALTNSDNFNTTSSTTNAGISSTTALTSSTTNSVNYTQSSSGTYYNYLRPLYPYSSTSQGAITITETTGITGYSSRESTSGYSGVSGVIVTDGYSRTEIVWDKNNMQTYTATQITVSSQTSYTGEVWNVDYSNSYPTNITTTITRDIFGDITSFSQSKWNTLTGASQLKRTWNESSLIVSAKINNSAYKLSTYSSKQSTTYYPYINITDVSMYTNLTKYAELHYGIGSALWLTYPTTSSAGNQVDWTNKKITMSTTTTWYNSTGYNFFTSAILKSDTKTSTQSYSKTHFEGISAHTGSGMLYGTFGFDLYRRYFTDLHTNTNYSFQYGNTTTINTYKTFLSIWKTSATFSYKTSEELVTFIGSDKLRIVTGYLSESYKHINYDNTWDISTSLSTYSTSSIQPGNMSSTTALTRSSDYLTSSVTTNAGISSITALTNITTSTESVTYTSEI